MKNILNTLFCVAIAAVIAFTGIIYADYAIKKDGYSGNEKFLTVNGDLVEICFFGDIKIIDVSQVKTFFDEFTVRQLKNNIV